MKRFKLMLVVALAVAMALTLVPATAEHCQSDLVIFFGTDAGGGVRRGLNLGAGGCNADPNDEALNTNFITPGATHAIVGAFTGAAPASGTIDIGGVVTALTFTNLNSRWESQSIPVTGGDATATIDIGGGDTVSVTYAELP